jgi:multiple RNA-binding domain-containing protein 1
VWNALIVRTDTTISAVAKELGLAASEVLDKEADDMAVRVALAETHVINSTKRFLAEEGVDLDALEGALRGEKVKRSDTVILVKNLPWTAEEEAVRSLFRRFGLLARFVMPPSKAIAVVEFETPAAAKKAFKGLAYTRFQRVPLYLEWAPQGVISAPTPADTTTQSASTGAAAASESTGDAGTPGDADASVSVPNTVYVKNVNFDTSEETLQSVFATAGPIRAVRIPKRRHPKDKDVMLSMGFGFVEFATPEAVEEALKTLQGREVDGHSLELKRSTKRIDGSDEAAAKLGKRKRTAAMDGSEPSSTRRKLPTKVLVKNLAFQATKKDVKSLFASFGKLKTVRLPRKFDGSIRGFAFVEFLTHQEAKNAVSALAASHLYGRHLVVEWAEDAEELSTLRSRAGQDLAAAGGGATGARDKQRRKVDT